MRDALRSRGVSRAPRRVALAAPEPLSGWLNLASAVASLASIAAAVFVAVNRERAGWYALVPLAYLCLLATAALVLLAYQQFVFDRHRRYVLAIPTLQDALRILSEATYAVMAGQTEEPPFRRSLRDASSLLATAFTQITGTRCRVAIKMVSTVPAALAKAQLGPNDFEVTTLCRSDTERRDRRRPEPDLVAKNTDFRVIFQGEPYYFSNDLVAAARRFEYENSHWDPEAIKKDRVDYRSAIIWPLTPVDLDDATETHPPVIGFVCLDSAVRHVFSEEFDVALGQSFTHAVNLALWTLDRSRRGPAVQPSAGDADVPPVTATARSRRGAAKRPEQEARTPQRGNTARTTRTSRRPPSPSP